MFLADTLFNVFFYVILFLFALCIIFLVRFFYRNFGIEDLKEKKKSDWDFKYVYIPRSLVNRMRKPYQPSGQLLDYIEANILLPEETLIDVLPVLFTGKQVMTSSEPYYKWDEGTLLVLSDYNLHVCPNPLGSKNGQRVVGLRNIKNVEIEKMAKKDGPFAMAEPFLHVNYTNGQWNRYRCTYSNTASFIEKINLALHNRAAGMSRKRSVAEELIQLQALREQGVLTEEDWRKAKARFLGEPASKAQESADHIRKLHELYKSGVLSESEFNMKKWDILSKP